MIGFFEHQYLKYKKNHIKNLLALAKADGHMHPKEEALLYKIGKRYGIKDRQVKELIDSNEKYEVIVPDNHNDKMNLLYDLV
ncbi:MAG TPA: TerB family tellurite resistance protein, partial [Cyclobacteriaceae bacterium]